MPGPPQAQSSENKRSLTYFTPASWNLWGSREWERKRFGGHTGKVRPGVGETWSNIRVRFGKGWRN